MIDLSDQDWNCEGCIKNYDKPSGKFCPVCGKEMTIGEEECFGTCSNCYNHIEE